MRFYLLVAASLLTSCGYDPAVSVNRKGTIASDWDLPCIQTALGSLGNVETTEPRDMHDPHDGRMLRKKNTTVTLYSHNDGIALDIWLSATGRWQFEQSWGRLGNKLSDTEKRTAIARFDRELKTLEQACHIQFQTIEASND